MTLRRWGHVHAGGESCARAGEGVTFPKCKSVQYFLSYSGFKSRPSFSITLYKNTILSFPKNCIPSHVIRIRDLFSCITMTHGNKNTEFHIAIKFFFFFTIAPNTCVCSVWNLLNFTILAPRIFRWLLYF